MEPFEVTLRTDVPLMPPGKVEKTEVAGGVKITWEANAYAQVQCCIDNAGSNENFVQNNKQENIIIDNFLGVSLHNFLIINNWIKFN